MKELQLRAYGKINLGLDVVRRREDGYHELRMIMQTVGLFDGLTMKVIPENEIRLTTNLSFLPTNQNNLIYKAIALLKEEFGIKKGIEVRLEKRIPVAAGMAGGSSNAAAAHVIILVFSKDLGSAVIFFAGYLIMVFIATKNYFYLFAGILGGAGASIVAYHMFSHVRTRVIAFLRRLRDRKSTRLNSSHTDISRMPSSA